MNAIDDLIRNLKREMDYKFKDEAKIEWDYGVMSDVSKDEFIRREVFHRWCVIMMSN